MGLPLAWPPHWESYVTFPEFLHLFAARACGQSLRHERHSNSTMSARLIKGQNFVALCSMSRRSPFIEDAATYSGAYFDTP